MSDLCYLTGMPGGKDVLNGSREEGKNLSKFVVYENGASSWSEPVTLDL